MTIEWRVSPSFPDYEVSENGDVRRCRPGRTRFVTGNLLRPVCSKGYYQFALRQAGERKGARASVLVAEAFIGLKPFDNAQVCHNDGTKNNDHYSNLRWDTPLNNQADRIIHGTTVEGIKNPRARLSFEDVAEIKKLSAEGRSNTYLAKQFGVSYGTIWCLINGRNWKCSA